MTQTAQPTITRDSACAEIEATHAGFHELLNSLSDADFKKKSGNGSWTNGQLMWHLAWGMTYVPKGVARCRASKDLFMPRGLFNFINPWLTRWGSRGITQQKVGKMYDDANAQVLSLLQTIKDDEWSKGCTMAGTGVTIESEFRNPAEHFAEHKADILKSLGRTQ
jgi:hypothetical protein